MSVAAIYLIYSVAIIAAFIYCLASFGNEGFNRSVKTHFAIYGAVPTVVMIVQESIRNAKIEVEDNGNY